MTSLGCKLNQSEIETLARTFAADGHQVVSDPAEGEVIILNSCTVTQIAARKSRQLARRLHRANESAKIIVTGCFAEMAPDQSSELPGVAWIVGNPGKDRLPELLSIVQPSGPARTPLDGREIPGLRTRASIKIQDGCDNECTYCIVRIARGPQRSRSAEAILTEIRNRLQSGYREIVLTGVHIGAYGQDRAQDAQTSLWELVEGILLETDTPRLRLSSIEPWDICDSNLVLWQNRRLCRHLHLPLQSGSDSVLSRMRRRYAAADFTRLVESIRAAVPEMAITTDVIVGFPGETEADFRATLQLVEAMQFSKVHVFPYSSRPGTEAAGFPDQIAPPLKQERVRRLAAAARQGEVAFRTQFIGRTVDVLWESQKDARHWSGLTDHYVRVFTHNTADLHNTITPAYITSLAPSGIRGTVLSTHEDPDGQMLSPGQTPIDQIDERTS